MFSKPSKKLTAQGGFTLMELLVVMAILGLLMSLVGPRVLSQLGGAKTKTTLIQIKDLEQSLEMYKLDVGRFPTTDQGLNALMQKPSGVVGWNGPYLKSAVPLDRQLACFYCPLYELNDRSNCRWSSACDTFFDLVFRWVAV